jgi:hypothetical protein
MLKSLLYLQIIELSSLVVPYYLSCGIVNDEVTIACQDLIP